MADDIKKPDLGELARQIKATERKYKLPGSESFATVFDVLDAKLNKQLYLRDEEEGYVAALLLYDRPGRTLNCYLAELDDRDLFREIHLSVDIRRAFPTRLPTRETYQSGHFVPITQFSEQQDSRFRDRLERKIPGNAYVALGESIKPEDLGELIAIPFS